MEERELITTAAKRLGVPVETIRTATKRGSIPYTKVKNVKYLDLASVDRWYALHRAKIEYRESVSPVGEKR